MKFNEVQKYVTNLRYIFSLEPLVISESIFQQQPQELKNMIIDAGKKASEHSVMFLLEKEHQIRRALEQKGMVLRTSRWRANLERTSDEIGLA